MVEQLESHGWVCEWCDRTMFAVTSHGSGDSVVLEVRCDCGHGFAIHLGEHWKLNALPPHQPFAVFCTTTPDARP